MSPSYLHRIPTLWAKIHHCKMRWLRMTWIVLLADKGEEHGRCSKTELLAFHQSVAEECETIWTWVLLNWRLEFPPRIPKIKLQVDLICKLKGYINQQFKWGECCFSVPKDKLYDTDDKLAWFQKIFPNYISHLDKNSF